MLSQDELELQVMNKYSIYIYIYVDILYVVGVWCKYHFQVISLLYWETWETWQEYARIFHGCRLVGYPDDCLSRNWDDIQISRAIPDATATFLTQLNGFIWIYFSVN